MFLLIQEGRDVSEDRTRFECKFGLDTIDIDAWKGPTRRIRYEFHFDAYRVPDCLGDRGMIERSSAADVIEPLPSLNSYLNQQWNNIVKRDVIFRR